MAGQFRLISIAGVLLVASGCATVFSPGPDKVRVTTDPTGAKIFVDDKIAGESPVDILLPRGGEGIVRIEKEGYEPVTVDRDKVLNGWFFPGNALWGLIWPAVPVALAVDAIGGNYGKYSDEPISLQLTPVPAGGKVAKGTPSKGKTGAKKARPESEERTTAALLEDPDL